MRAYPFLGVANVDSAVVISTLLTGTLYLLTAVSELHTCSLVSEVTCFLVLVPQSTSQFLCFWEASERKLRHWINGNNWIIYHFSANLNIFSRWLWLWIDWWHPKLSLLGAFDHICVEKERYKFLIIIVTIIIIIIIIHKFYIKKTTSNKTFYVVMNSHFPLELYPQ